MLAFVIENSDIKDFMNKLLVGECFDKLEVREAVIETIVRYEISGNINKQYLKPEETRSFVRWSELKGYVFQLIKGHTKPKSIKIVFSLDDNALKALDDNAASAFLNIFYENDSVKGTSGASQKTFSLDKTVSYSWDDMVKRFFKKNAIPIKELKE